jgi:hypothetical protein
MTTPSNQPQVVTPTCACGNPGEGWPDDMCQECWAAHCDRAWWEELRRVQEAGRFAIAKGRQVLRKFGWETPRNTYSRRGK